jgi:DNA-binding CsgD family transcriptional regulator
VSEPSSLVDAIYEAAFVPECWPSVLESLRACSGSASGSLLVFDGVTTPRWRTTQRTEDVLLRFSQTDAWKRSERDPERLLEVSLGDQYFHCLNDLMTPEQLERDSVRQLLEEVGVAWQIGTAIPLPTDEQVVFTFEREIANGRHNAASIARLTALRPHLARAGVIATRLGLERARGALEAMRELGMPAALLDRGGTIRDTNALMTSALIDTRGGGRIVLGHPPGDAALSAILKGQSSARSIALPATETRPGRIAHVVPLVGAARDIFAGSLSLLVMHVASGSQDLPDIALLRGLFDLSPAEARLTAVLAGGSELSQAAADCNIRLSTARSYLEAIFRKTGVHRQSELVALIAGSIGRY